MVANSQNDIYTPYPIDGPQYIAYGQRAGVGVNCFTVGNLITHGLYGGDEVTPAYLTAGMFIVF